jgi:phosphatidylglycerophosphatase A
MVKLLATWLYVGLCPKGPGTAGSLAGLIMMIPILLLPMGWAWLTAATMLVSVAGIVMADRYMNLAGAAHDPQEIVIDEVAGQWLTFCTCYGWIALMMGGGDAAQHAIDALALKPELLMGGFVFFRLFDIIKPWPISWADRRVMGGLGVMLDDLLAGVIAGTFLFAQALLWPIITGDMMVPHVP